jgi:hypothetical protein
MTAGVLKISPLNFFSTFHLLSGEFIVRLLDLIGAKGEFIPLCDIEMTGIFFQKIYKE